MEEEKKAKVRRQTSFLYWHDEPSNSWYNLCIWASNTIRLHLRNVCSPSLSCQDIWREFFFFIMTVIIFLCTAPTPIKLQWQHDNILKVEGQTCWGSDQSISVLYLSVYKTWQRWAYRLCLSLTTVSTILVLLFLRVLTVWKTSMKFCCFIISLRLQMAQKVPERPPPVLWREQCISTSHNIREMAGGEEEKFYQIKVAGYDFIVYM